ncbi:MAG: class I SAM-dependent methyltransferase [Alphaproteobacteria bacterium]|nr:class I SAM-dependent methyltransferase [Alphaproteobacteria bacterium]
MSQQSSLEIGNGEPVPPHPVMREFYRSEQERRSVLISAFDASARQYDRINTSASLGSDARYRRSTLARSRLAPGMKVLDIGCGTGMMAQSAKAVVGPEGLVVGVDPSRAMLDQALAHDRVDGGIIGIAERLPVKDAEFDLLTMSFALRHVSDLVGAFGEMARVLRPGGELLILEITKPPNRAAYHLLRFHLKFVVPGLARLVRGGRSARWLYKYCWESHEQCVPPETILSAIRQAGFADVRRTVTFGVFSEYRATKR